MMLSDESSLKLPIVPVAVQVRLPIQGRTAVISPVLASLGGRADSWTAEDSYNRPIGTANRSGPLYPRFYYHSSYCTAPTENHLPSNTVHTAQASKRLLVPVKLNTGKTRQWLPIPLRCSCSFARANLLHSKRTCTCIV